MFFQSDVQLVLIFSNDILIRDHPFMTSAIWGGEGEIGLKFTSLEKWQRRGNLYVSILFSIRNIKPNDFLTVPIKVHLLLWLVNPEILSELS